MFRTKITFTEKTYGLQTTQNESEKIPKIILKNSLQNAQEKHALLSTEGRYRTLAPGAIKPTVLTKIALGQAKTNRALSQDWQNLLNAML